ncbi:zeta toxin family protein [Nonomuraea sp. CA-143628]|uniref:zeta toxin family protein n=1 Tax=Nonomuraea sp. CA-143628 TaxID=3239997 RepID=UPI003D9019B7
MGFDGFLVPDCVKPYVGWVVGMDWPEGDESGCFRLADACVTAAHRLVEGSPADQPWSATKIGADWEGDAHLAFAKHVSTVVGGQVADLVNQLINTAVALNNIGVQIQYAKYMIEITVWLLVGQILYLTAAALASSGASLALIPPRVQLARLTVAQIAKLVLRNIAIFAAIVAAMDGGVQGLQMIQGRRDEIDLRQLGVSALTGGAMGGLMGLLSGGLTRLATPALRAGLTRSELSVAEKLLAAASSSLYGQAAQYAVTGGITTAGAMLAEGDFSWDLLAKGITSSALGADGQHVTTSLHHGGFDGGSSATRGTSPDGGSPSAGGPSPDGGSPPNRGTTLSQVKDHVAEPVHQAPPPRPETIEPRQATDQGGGAASHQATDRGSNGSSPRQEPGRPPVSRIERLLNHDATPARPDAGPDHPSSRADAQDSTSSLEGRANQPPAFHHAPTERELKTIFEKRIVPEMLTGATRSAEPTMIVVGGQPGAGKSTTIARLHDGFHDRGGVLQIIVDEYKQFYPEYDRLRAWNDIATNSIVQPIAKKWQSMAFDYAIANGYNVIVEATLGNPKEAAAFIRLFQDHGYRIETELVATPRAQSRLSILTRYLDEKVNEGAGRLVPGKDHDVRFFGSAEVIGSLESSNPPAVVDAVRIRLRSGEAVFANERGPDGAWTGETGAQEALRAERERPWTATERAEFTRRLNNLRAMLEHQQREHPEDAPTYDRISREADEVQAMAEPWLNHAGAGDYLRDLLGMTPGTGDWSPERSLEFERRIGDVLFHDPEANAAADRTLGRLREVLTALNRELYPELPEARTEQTFFKDDPSSPGQVGRDAVSLTDLRRDGNLRMLMTAIYNAGFYGKDELALQWSLFELRTDPDWRAIAARAGLDVSRLEPVMEGEINVPRDVFEVSTLGTHAPEAGRAAREFEESQVARWSRTIEDREAYRMTPQDFVDRDIPMHALEIAAHQRHLRSQFEATAAETGAPRAEPASTEDVRNLFDDPAEEENWSRLTDPPRNDDSTDPQAPLEWMLGTARYGMHTDHPWVRQISGESHLPLIAGISGTAARLHSLFRWIRPEGVTEEHFTRALLSWMLSTEDHSIYEIVRGIEVASPHLFGDPDIPYVDAIDLYRRILPLETLADIAAGMNPAGKDTAR